MNPKPELPVPDEASARHSRDVAAHIAALIDAAGGRIPFSTFMHEALYAPGLGYYVAGAAKLGAAGDFITAPELSPLFGNVIARQIAPVIRQADDFGILEPGAGSGALAVQVLAKLRCLDALPARYLVLEVSAELKARQADRFAREVPWFLGRIEWIDAIPSGFTGVVLANEVADAMPVERFRIEEGTVRQACVRHADGRFSWCFEAAPTPFRDAVRRIEASLGAPLADGYESEFAPAVGAWVCELCESVDRGLILLFDYGLPRQAYYAPDRRDGWLRCHFRHRAHADPLVLPGIQDLTSWVDFTAVAEAAAGCGAAVAGFMTQAHFLLRGGLEEEFADFPARPVAAQVELSGEVRRLTLPDEMGENFKCIGLARGNVELPSVFGEADRTHTL